MGNKWFQPVAIGLVALVVVAGCRFFALFSRDEPGCSAPSKEFSEADLIGTWVAGVPDQRETLIIRADGKYKQIVHVEFVEGPPTDYESEWQPWMIEYSQDGIPYLHLTGMRFCGMNPGISCQITVGDGHDNCRDQYIKMDGEGILLVLETVKGTSPGQDERQYVLHYPLGTEDSWVYTIQEP